MEHFAAAEREAAAAVRHDPAALGDADRLAKVGLAREAVFALPAFGGVERNDVVARRETAHAGAGLDDHARALMAEDRREQPFGVGAGEREFIGVTDAGRLDLDQTFACPGAFDIDVLDDERLAGLMRDGGSGFHPAASPVKRTRTSFRTRAPRAPVRVPIRPPARRPGTADRPATHRGSNTTRKRRLQPRAVAAAVLVMAMGGAPGERRGPAALRQGRELRRTPPDATARGAETVLAGQKSIAAVTDARSATTPRARR